MKQMVAALRGRLRDLVDAFLPPACVACEGPSSTILCPRCAESVEPAPFERHACVMFGGAIADAVRRAKFRHDAAAAHLLGAFWVERIELSQCAPLPAVDAIAFVPAPFRRRIVRGFDLPAILASALAAHAGVPVVDALACTRTDAPLSFGADKAARAAIVSGRYTSRASFADQKLLLIDDVHTTGATLHEAARVLEAAGAKVVQAPFSIAP